jgi:hypothetical protein
MCVTLGMLWKLNACRGGLIRFASAPWVETQGERVPMTSRNLRAYLLEALSDPDFPRTAALKRITDLDWLLWKSERVDDDRRNAAYYHFKWRLEHMSGDAGLPDLIKQAACEFAKVFAKKGKRS